MSQVVFDTIDPSTTSGNQLAQILNDFKDAVISGFAGVSRPTQIDPGGHWIDTSLQATLSVWDFKVYTGSGDITVFRLNLATGTTSISGSDNTFEVTRISADSVGPIFKLIKERIATNGQTLFGDTLGEIQFIGAADDLTNPISVKIRAIATDNFTGTEQGAALIFEVVNIDTTTLNEFMRIAGDKLGIGLVNPAEKLHVRGNIKADRVADDALPAKNILTKSRVSGSGQVLLNDVIAEDSFRSTNETGVEIEVARIQVVATENHTSANQGTKLVISTKNNLTNTFVEKIVVQSSGVTVDGVVVDSSTVQLKAEKNAVNGYAGLGADGKVAAAQLPSYVDDVLEYANLVGMPVTGEAGKIYISLDNGKTYRWSGSVYVEVSPSEVNSVAGKTGIVTLVKADVGLADVDNTSDAVKNSATATLTNKTITGASIQSPSRLDPKKDTKSNLTTYALTAQNGEFVYATDTKEMFTVKDGVLSAVGGAGAENPMTTGGDIIFGGISGVPTRLANGTAGQVLQSNGTTLAPTWGTPAGGGVSVSDINKSLTLTALYNYYVQSGVDISSAIFFNGMYISILYSYELQRSYHPSPDFIWTPISTTTTRSWRALAASPSMVVAVAFGGTTAGNRVATSTDGITWTLRATPSDNLWVSVTYGNGMFVAVSNSGSNNRVMTSTDGITWTTRTTNNNSWVSVTYGNGMFVAVSDSGTNNSVMTSTDGITWTTRTTNTSTWVKVTFTNGIFAAVAFGGGVNSVMTSTDGITWTLRTTPSATWRSIAGHNGVFVAVGSDDNAPNIMTSTDGINWVVLHRAYERYWSDITYIGNRFIAFGADDDGTQIILFGQLDIP